MTAHLRVLLDLDGTLVDRQGAFEDWARSFLAEIGAPRGELDWLREADENGYRPRLDLATAIIDRWRLTAAPSDLEQRLQSDVVGGIACYPGVLEALLRLRSSGAELVLVTNGTVAQQSEKLRRTGLDRVLDRIVISEAAGVKKPDPRIFALAVEGLADGRETWMVGDHPSADIDGGRTAGFSTAWVSHGRTWPHAWEPTLSAPTTVALLEMLLAAR